MITNNYDLLPLPRLAAPAEQIQVMCQQNRGARIGESAIISQKMHFYNPHHPQEIQIVQNIDAGQLFYHQRNCGMIFHLDIFHQCGQVNHHAVATALQQAVAIYNEQLIKDGGLLPLADPNLVDIQTNSGGGRITGNLCYGQKLTLRQAHLNHVHVTAMLSDKHQACLFYLVLAVENVILAHGLELRCIEKFILSNNSGNQLMDLSEYTNQTDSLLQDTANLTTPLLTATQQKSSQENRENQFFSYSTEAASASSCRTKQAIQRPPNIKCNQQTLLGLQEKSGAFIVQYLPFLHKKSQVATPIMLPDVENHLRRTLARIRSKSTIAGGKMLQNAKQGHHKSPTVAKSDLDCSSGVFDITATVHAAASRMVLTNSASITMSREDLRFSITPTFRKCDVCFLIDASASMEGARLVATQSLLFRLIRTSIRKVSIITFQGDSAQISIPFTANYDSIKLAIDAIHAQGSTPLAMGIKTCLDYLKKAASYRPLIVLITDGLPCYDTNNTNAPLQDALASAREIKQYGYSFTCIGLTSQQDYLADLAKAAKGSLYVCKDTPLFCPGYTL